MNLAWLAAVLQPHDVAPHPNFSNDKYDAQTVPRLAAVVIGDSWRLHRAEEFAFQDSSSTSTDGDVVDLVQRCLRQGSIAVGVRSLAARLLEEPPVDKARAAALTLVVCSAAAELDDYETCFSVLEAQLHQDFDGADPDAVLARAALLQQKALRLRDSGQDNVDLSIQVYRMLQDLDATRCSNFPTSPGVSRSSDTTLQEIRGSLIDAATSLIPIRDARLNEESDLPTWQERVRSPASSIAIRTARTMTRVYADFVGKMFDEKFGSSKQAIGGPSRPDIFHSVLMLELMGHGGVYTARKELALLRLVQIRDEESELSDALRLLRHAGAKNELDLALRKLRLGGPLSALSLNPPDRGAESRSGSKGNAS